MSRNEYANYYRVHGKFPPGVVSRVSVTDRAYLTTQRSKTVAPKKPVESRTPVDAIAEMPSTPPGVKTKSDVPSRKSVVEPQQKLEGLTVLDKRPAVPLSKKAQVLRKKLAEVGDSDEEEEYTGKVPRLLSLEDGGDEDDEKESSLGTMPKAAETAGGSVVPGEGAETDDESKEDREDDAHSSFDRELESLASGLPTPPPEIEIAAPKAEFETPPKPDKEKKHEKKEPVEERPYNSPKPKTKPGKDAEALRDVIGQPPEFGPGAGHNYIFLETDSAGNATPKSKRSMLSAGLHAKLKEEIKKHGGRMPIGQPIEALRGQRGAAKTDMRGLVVTTKARHEAYEKKLKEEAAAKKKAELTAKARAELEKKITVRKSLGPGDRSLSTGALGTRRGSLPNLLAGTRRSASSGSSSSSSSSSSASTAVI